LFKTNNRLFPPPVLSIIQISPLEFSTIRSGIVYYTFSNIFVADEKNNEVIILNSNGDEVVRFSKLLKKKGYLNIVAPSQIVIDRTGRLWIVMQGKVLVFHQTSQESKGTFMAISLWHQLKHVFLH
jgi:hypothetical protein